MRFLLLALVLASLLAPPLAADPDPRPNIVYILLDDIGINDINVYSNQNLIETDTIDALAGAGTMFTDYYSSPVCSPTRFALLTGAYSSVSTSASSWAPPPSAACPATHPARS
jgi:arylsulfatase A-like enzyme